MGLRPDNNNAVKNKLGPGQSNDDAFKMMKCVPCKPHACYLKPLVGHAYICLQAESLHWSFGGTLKRNSRVLGDVYSLVSRTSAWMRRIVKLLKGFPRSHLKISSVKLFFSFSAFFALKKWFWVNRTNLRSSKRVCREAVICITILTNENDFEGAYGSGSNQILVQNKFLGSIFCRVHTVVCH